MSKKDFIKYYIQLFNISKDRFIFNLKNFGLKLSILNLFGEVSTFYLIKNKKFASKIREKQHAQIYNTLINKYSNFINEYKTKNIPIGKNCKIIWTYWAQGINNAPIIIQNCLKSIEKNSGDYKLVILTNHTYKDYVNLPDEIIEKMETGTISLAHFSDILRAKLLSEYGGIWVDSTMFFYENVFNKFDDKIFNSSYRIGKWMIFFMGGKPNKLFQFIYDFLVQYNKDYNEFITYFLMDYAIEIAYNNFNECKQYIDNANLENQNIFYFIDNFSDTYNKKEFEKICNDYKFFKLSYKNSKNINIYNNKGQLTNFGYFSKK